MLSAAIKTGLPIKTRAKHIIMREPELPTGAPDLIAVEPRRTQRRRLSDAAQLRPIHLKLLHHLSESGAITEDAIVKALGFTPKQTAEALKTLTATAYVERNGNTLTIRPRSQVFHAVRIVAIEAKMTAWREAIDQAIANLWFASHSYILVPALKCISLVRDEAAKYGIGVLVFDGKKTRTILRPRKNEIPASYGSWLISEFAAGVRKN